MNTFLWFSWFCFIFYFIFFFGTRFIWTFCLYPSIVWNRCVAVPSDSSRGVRLLLLITFLFLLLLYQQSSLLLCVCFVFFAPPSVCFEHILLPSHLLLSLLASLWHFASVFPVKHSSIFMIFFLILCLPCHWLFHSEQQKETNKDVLTKQGRCLCSNKIKYNNNNKVPMYISSSAGKYFC